MLAESGAKYLISTSYHIRNTFLLAKVSKTDVDSRLRSILDIELVCYIPCETSTALFFDAKLTAGSVFSCVYLF
jgi:hypothetical protein